MMPRQPTATGFAHSQRRANRKLRRPQTIQYASSSICPPYFCVLYPNGTNAQRYAFLNLRLPPATANPPTENANRVVQPPVRSSNQPNATGDKMPATAPVAFIS